MTSRQDAEPHDEFGKLVETTVQENQRALREKARLEAKAEEKRVYQIYKRAAQNTDALLVLQDIFALSGWDKLSIAANPVSFEMNPLTTSYREGRRSVWNEVRAKIDRATRILIENPVIEELDADE